MTLSDWLGIIGIFVGLIGIVVGIIGAKSLSKANQIKTKSITDSIISQTETMIINNGVDTYAVIKIAKDVTKEELQFITKTLEATTLDLKALREQLDAMPHISFGKELPAEGLREGDIFIQIDE